MLSLLRYSLARDSISFHVDSNVVVLSYHMHTEPDPEPRANRADHFLFPTKEHPTPSQVVQPTTCPSNPSIENGDIRRTGNRGSGILAQ